MLQLSPSSVIAKSEAMQTIAKVVGDFQESEAIPAITGRVLLKVSEIWKDSEVILGGIQPKQVDNSSSFAFSVMNYWLLVHRDMITYTGSE